MPRDGQGDYTLPGGNPVAPGTVISATWANPTMEDLGNEITNSLDRLGRGGMLVPFRNQDGDTINPGITFTLQEGTGISRSEADGSVFMSIASNPKTRWYNDTSPAGQQQPFEIWNGNEYEPPLTGGDDIIVNNVTITGTLDVVGQATFDTIIAGDITGNAATAVTVTLGAQIAITSCVNLNTVGVLNSLEVAGAIVGGGTLLVEGTATFNDDIVMLNTGRIFLENFLDTDTPAISWNVDPSMGFNRNGVGVFEAVVGGVSVIRFSNVSGVTIPTEDLTILAGNIIISGTVDGVNVSALGVQVATNVQDIIDLQGAVGDGAQLAADQTFTGSNTFSQIIIGSINGNAATATTAGTVTTAAQPAITSLGTLATLTVTAAIVGSVTGSAATVTGAAQGAITSLGTLTGLTVTGVIAGSINGNAATATSATTAGTAGTVTTAAQPAITSVGTLTALAVTGALTSGTLVCTGNITAFSDDRLKENLTPIENSLDKIGQLMGYTYDKDGARNAGLVAQDVQSVLPEAVGEHDGYLTLNDAAITGLIINALNECRERIDALT